MAVGPIGGIAFLKLNGMQYQLSGEMTIQPNMTENDWMANADQSVSMTQKAVVPYMQMKLRDTGGLSIQQLGALQGITITTELINGKVYTLQQGAPWGEIKSDAIKGEIDIKFGGPACYEQLSS